MEEIKVGEYVRTVEGHIFKRDNNINTGYFSYDDKLYAECHYLFPDEEQVVKHSPNITDLIEVGDYVNGGQVREKTKDFIRITNGNRLCEYLENVQEIKTIVTKEQFKRVMYEVK